MHNLKLLKFDELIDLLAEQTSRYTKMVKSKRSEEEFQNCKRGIKELQSEIETRKKHSTADRGSKI